MKTLNRALLAGLLGLGLASAAQAQSTSPDPSVPNPANPYPLNPVASDGTPLPRYNGVAGGLYAGRSAAVDPVGGFVGLGTGVAAGAVDTGLDAAGTRLDAAGTAVNGTLGTVDGVVR